MITHLLPNFVTALFEFDMSRKYPIDVDILSQRLLTVLSRWRQTIKTADSLIGGN